MHQVQNQLDFNIGTPSDERLKQMFEHEVRGAQAEVLIMDDILMLKEAAFLEQIERDKVKARKPKKYPSYHNSRCWW